MPAEAGRVTRDEPQLRPTDNISQDRTCWRSSLSRHAHDRARQTLALITHFCNSAIDRPTPSVTPRPWIHLGRPLDCHLAPIPRKADLLHPWSLSRRLALPLGRPLDCHLASLSLRRGCVPLRSRSVTPYSSGSSPYCHLAVCSIASWPSSHLGNRALFPVVSLSSTDCPLADHPTASWHLPRLPLGAAAPRSGFATEQCQFVIAHLPRGF